MRTKYLKFLIFGALAILNFACSKDDTEPAPAPTPITTAISASSSSLSFDAAGGGSSLTITMTGKDWAANSNQTWCTLSASSSSLASQQITVTVLQNTALTTRNAVLTFVMDGKKTITVAVSQAASTSLYPSYNTSAIDPDATGMSSTAVQLAAKMKLGWNIGNTMEAAGGETAWGNPKVTKALIDLVKANGFNAIRIPCSWNQNSDAATAKISATWLARVKEVVQYCVDNDMYVIVNIHYDGGWLEKNVTEAKKAENNARQKAFWEQIATNLRDFDEHLLFASANEPNVPKDDTSAMAVLISYHQTFIDAVRSTGGKNAYRNLIVQGPSTDIEQTNALMNTLPIDKVANRMMAEVHFYPYQFALMDKDADWGKMFYYWGAGNHSTTDTDRNATWGEEAFIDEVFLSMKTKFVNKGIPVILGEFGAIRRDLTGDALTLHLKSRADFLKYVVKSAKANGLIPFYWDAGNLGVNTMSLFDRATNTVYDLQALTALQDGLK